MYNLLFSILGIGIAYFTIYLISTFFDIKPEYYLPVSLWISALLIFNIFLEKDDKHIFI